jgi:HSP20 family protein
MTLTRKSPLSELAHWEPFRDIERLQEEMNHLFERFMPAGEDRGRSSGIDFMPSAEMAETPEVIYLKLEVPGMEAKDIDVEVSDDVITISGERKSETKSEVGGVTRSEFQYGKFERIMSLPARVAAEGVKADYAQGILSLTLPKAPAAEKKTVKVNIS